MMTTMVDQLLQMHLIKLLILHAEHEQNCSTSTVRLVVLHMQCFMASTFWRIMQLWGPTSVVQTKLVIEYVRRANCKPEEGYVKNTWAKAKG